ncbi:MAG: hypothetical protein A2787_00600 [Omnitrophica WOR_2 bacterium RIFCSPHIGHO2_01_FULL_48_9]|nr:MAG: hypothetical protein A3D10_02705 [Omnitrophica WOR_2 bacterium RIFCSPHIGHO2_02_FULL_48_11]OGX33631.1 MAG: hypothetical protein A2787_00600 [Omnitrophica WOR_2 bacterium RIFCSPHIGHO2_01_FULL_48_9]
MFRSFLLFIFIFSLLLTAPLPFASAEGKYSIKEMTPEVQAALDSRRDRFEKLKELKSQGIVGENNRGYVELLTNDILAKALVDAENKDRKIIYQTIANQNELNDALETIEKVFAQVQRDKAMSGDKIQQEDGQWITK